MKFQESIDDAVAKKNYVQGTQPKRVINVNQTHLDLSRHVTGKGVEVRKCTLLHVPRESFPLAEKNSLTIDEKICPSVLVVCLGGKTKIVSKMTRKYSVSSWRRQKRTGKSVRNREGRRKMSGRRWFSFTWYKKRIWINLTYNKWNLGHFFCTTYHFENMVPSQIFA